VHPCQKDGVSDCSFASQASAQASSTISGNSPCSHVSDTVFVSKMVTPASKLVPLKTGEMSPVKANAACEKDGVSYCSPESQAIAEATSPIYGNSPCSHGSDTADSSKTVTPASKLMPLKTGEMSPVKANAAEHIATLYGLVAYRI
jgi:hypothetical protein